MDELIQYFKNLEEDETLKRIDDAYNRGWYDAMNNPEVKKALERMKPVVIKPEKTDEYHQSGDEFYLVRCPDCGKEFKLLGFKYSTDVRHCGCCGKAFTLDWSEE